MTRAFGGWLVLSLCLSPVTRAMDVPAGKSSAPSTQQVLERMHLQNEWEISAGRLAKSQGDSPSVRAFGERLASDQTFAERKVKRLSLREGFSLVQAPRTPADRERFERLDLELARLERARGPEFDRLFLATMQASHRESLKIMEEARAKTEDRQLKVLLGRLIPIHRQHLRVAQHLTVGPPRVR